MPDTASPMSLYRQLRFALRAVRLQKLVRADPARIERLRRRRLRALLRFAAERSPYYRDLLAGKDVDRLELADLPVMRKQTLMAEFDRVVTDPAVRLADVRPFLDGMLERIHDGRIHDGTGSAEYFRGRYALSHTSGSSGQSLVMLKEREQVELLFAMEGGRGHAVDTGPVEAATRFFRPARLAVVTVKPGLYPSAAAFAYMPEQVAHFIRTVRLSSTEPDMIGRLQAFDPTNITAYASVMVGLADAVEDGRLSMPHLRQMVNNSEALVPSQRERFERVFGVPLMDHYAMGECPFLTNGCRRGRGVHVNADWAILEVVDDDCRPVPDGQCGTRVLVTNLSNRIQPFIRYEVTDLVTMAEPGDDCGCGNRLPRIERIEGRAAERFTVGQGDQTRTLTPLVFQHAFLSLLEVREWQAVQTGPMDITLRVEMLPGAQWDEARARKEVTRVLRHSGFGADVAVRFERADGLSDDTGRGKYRRFVQSA